MKLKSWLTGSRILIIAFIISALSHLPFLNLGPRSVHVWRQANTLAVARNFAQEDMDILNPRVDRRLDSNGVTGMQFPSYEYIVAVGYKLFGIHNWVHRLVSLLISFWGAFGMYLLAKYLIKNDIAAGFAGLAYLFSPDLYYFGFSALPDILALACSVWGLYYFLKWFDSKFQRFEVPKFRGFEVSKVRGFENSELRTFGLSLLLIVLAGLTKIQFLAIGFFIAPYVLMNADIAKKRIISLVVFGITACAIPLLWYRRSVALIKSSGLEDFGITFRPESDWKKGLNTITQNLVSDLPDLLLNYASFILFLIGIYFFFKNRFWKSKWFLPMLFWTIALIAYHIIELAQMNVHSYYMMPYLPVLFLMLAYGVKHFSLKKPNSILLIILLIISPILTGLRIIPSRFTKTNPGIPTELYNANTRTELINASPQNALCIVGPDISGCIYFYHLEKKGFGFNELSELNQNIGTETRIENYIRRGATYLYTNDSSALHQDAILKHFDLVKNVESFYVFKIKN